MLTVIFWLCVQPWNFHRRLTDNHVLKHNIMRDTVLEVKRPVENFLALDKHANINCFIIQFHLQMALQKQQKT